MHFGGRRFAQHARGEHLRLVLEAVDDRMSFSPWHGVAAHRPLGSVMRVRKAAYEAARAFRESRNRQPVDEPRVLESLPG